MLTKALENVFTVHGLICSVIQVSMITGLLTLYIVFQVQVMGAEVMIGSQDYPNALATKPSKK